MTVSEKRDYAAQLMKSREKMNSYTQGSKRVYFFGYPDKAVGNTTQKGYPQCQNAWFHPINPLHGRFHR